MKSIDELISEKYSYSQYTSTLQNFFKYEFYYLSSQKSLSPKKLKSNSKITFAEFQNYFPYPMILTQGFFNSFNHGDKISLSEYTTGMMNLYTGDFKTKANIIYDIFSINKGVTIHYEDVKIILNYTHIYYNKGKQDLLNKIINDFFTPYEEYTRKQFINNIINKNSDLFFLILSYFFEYKTFTLDLLQFLQNIFEPGNTGLNGYKNYKDSLSKHSFSNGFSNFNQINKGVINSNNNNNLNLSLVNNEVYPLKHQCSKFKVNELNNSYINSNLSSFRSNDKSNGKKILDVKAKIAVKKSNNSNNSNNNLYKLNNDKMPGKFCVEYIKTNFSINIDYSKFRIASCNELSNLATLKPGKNYTQVKENENNFEQVQSKDHINFNYNKGLESYIHLNYDKESLNKNHLNTLLTKESTSNNNNSIQLRTTSGKLTKFSNNYKEDLKRTENEVGQITSEEEEENLKELADLDYFENDFTNFKFNLNIIALYINNFALPTFGPRCNVLENGMFLSKLKSNFEGMNNNFNNDLSKINNFFDNSLMNFNMNSFHNNKRGNNNINYNYLSPQNKNSIFSNKISFSAYETLYKKDSIENLSFSDMQYQFNKNQLECEIFMFNSNKSKVKKYKMYFYSTFSFIIILRLENLENGNLVNEQSHIITFNGSNIEFSRDINNNESVNNNPVSQNDKDMDQKPKIKRFIPINKLFIHSIDENYLFSKKTYIKIELLSSAIFKRTSYTFLFDKVNHSLFDNFKKLLISATNFTRIQDEYIDIKDIGKGTFAKIKLMKQKKTKLICAVKKVKKIPDDLEEFTSLNWEKDIIQFLINFQETKYLLKFYRCVETADSVYFVSEYIRHGSISNYIKKSDQCLPSSIILKLLSQIIYGVKVLHQYGIMHRDLKLENVLMEYDKDPKDFTAKIIDFGLSKVVTRRGTTKECYGTLFYCPPEILLSKPYNHKIDIWSIGIIAFYLQFAVMPFDIEGNENGKTISRKIIINNLVIPEEEECEEDEDAVASLKIKKLITNCLVKEVTIRSGIEEIEALINK